MQDKAGHHRVTVCSKLMKACTSLNFITMQFSETNTFTNEVIFGYAPPPGDYRYCSLDDPLLIP